MNRAVSNFTVLTVALSILQTSCSHVAAKDTGSEDPPSAEVDHIPDGNLVRVEHPERFPVVLATSHSAAADLKVTGSVVADIARNVPVVSIASGRILEVQARLGDQVTKGQVLLKVLSADIASAFADYREAVADEKVANAQLARTKILYSKGAIALKELEVAQQTEEKADVVVETAAEHLQVLGADKDHPSPIVEVRAPASGVITDQQVTTASGTQGLSSPNAFTISDLSHVWVMCDVYENDLPLIQLGEYADIRLNAYPNIVLKGRISNIGAVLDPNIRTAKVRIEVENPGLIRLGMFVEATFHGQSRRDSVVPATAILHLHDRDWVFIPQGVMLFRRVEVLAGAMIAPGRQEVLSGIRAGDRVVVDALLLENSSGQ